MIQQWGVTCSTQRPTTTRDSTGGVINTYGSQLSSVVVYIQQGGGAEGDTLGAQRNTLSATGYCALGTNILPQDRLFVGTNFWDIQEVRTPDERTYADGLAHMRLALTRVLPL
jgi:hypothetical protein